MLLSNQKRLLQLAKKMREKNARFHLLVLFLLQVLFRLNMLVVTLCFVMNRHYQFYYFVPLVSFWFVVIYVTMAIWPQASEKVAEGEWIDIHCSVLVGSRKRFKLDLKRVELLCLQLNLY